MNPGHAELCSSTEWAQFLHDEVLPAALDNKPIDAPTLEIGPGYGAATRWLVERAPGLTALEVDPGLAAALDADLPAVRVERGSAVDMPFADGAFATVVCFTMMHHVATVAEQDAIFGEVARVLRPGGWFIGSDSVASPDLERFHAGDTYNPLDAATLVQRLRNAGLVDATAQVLDRDGPLLVFGGRAPRGAGPVTATSTVDRSNARPGARR